jgi:threonine/homoserine/homoserine lactone efflux protein
MLRYLTFGVTFAFAAAVQPGPLQSYLVSQTLSKGWRRTAPAVFAPLLSDGPIIALVLLGLSRVPAWLERALQCGGGVFLLYLAFGAYRTWNRFAKTGPPQGESRHATLLKAATVNILNPNPYLGWSLVMGPLFLKGWRETPAHGIALIVSFYATIVLGLFGTILLFSAARNLGPKVSRALIGISAIALAGFGLYELLLGSGLISW